MQNGSNDPNIKHKIKTTHQHKNTMLQKYKS